jgi:hypothetical protein
VPLTKRQFHRWGGRRCIDSSGPTSFIPITQFGGFVLIRRRIN